MNHNINNGGRGGGGGSPLTPHLYIEKILRKDNYALVEKGKYWHNQFRKAF